MSSKEFEAVNPVGDVIRSGIIQVSRNSTLEVYLIPDVEGLYVVYAEITDLPIINRLNSSSEFFVTILPFSSQMDAGTVPVLSGGAALAVIGLVLRKKLGGALDSLSVEWDG